MCAKIMYKIPQKCHKGTKIEPNEICFAFHPKEIKDFIGQAGQEIENWKD
jgi:hypothetical protein